MSFTIENHSITSELQSQLIDTKLYSNRQLFISEGIDSKVAKRVIGTLFALDHEKPGEPILMYQNSPAGRLIVDLPSMTLCVLSRACNRSQYRPMR